MDYLFIGIVFSFAFSIIFLVLGLNNLGEFPLNVIYHILGSIFSFETGLLIIAADQLWGPILQWMFTLLGTLNFVFVLLFSFDAYKIRREKRWAVGEGD